MNKKEEEEEEQEKGEEEEKKKKKEYKNKEWERAFQGEGLISSRKWGAQYGWSTARESGRRQAGEKRGPDLHVFVGMVWNG